MKLAEAQRLDAEGTLQRRVLTEQGWYQPRQLGKKTAQPAKPSVLPQVFWRKPGRPKKNEEPI